MRRDVLFCLPVPQSWPLWKKAAARQHRYLPPGGGRQADVGNLVKLLDDALEGAGLIANDGQIVGGECVKLYGQEPGYLIQLTPLVQGARQPSEAEPASWWFSKTTPPRTTTG